MNKCGLKLSKILYSVDLFRDLIQNFHQTEKFDLEPGYKMKFDVRAFHHEPSWKDFGIVRCRAIDDFVLSIWNQLPNTDWISTISILYSTQSIPLHKERYEKTSSLVIPLVGDFQRWKTFFEINDGKGKKELVIDSPTLIQTDLPHGVELVGGEDLRVVMCFRSRLPETFESVAERLSSLR